MMGTDSRRLWAGYIGCDEENVMACESFVDFDKEAAARGGTAAMRRYLEDPTTEYPEDKFREMAKSWLALRHLEDREREANIALTAAGEAAAASRRAATWTFWAALAAAAGAIGTAVQAWYAAHPTTTAAVEATQPAASAPPAKAASRP